ncbi:MAG: alpha/beta fold hydrolase [Spirochaetaceae bacterium]|nr:MAG: alpha/beta fold hydrolase [Spirochaetaceae bacterium]
MKRTIIMIVTAVSIILVFLLLPLILKKKNPSATVGPDLSELEYSEIFFENAYASIQLSGMLFLPEGDGPFPTAVIIHGSGSSKRNSVWYLSVAHHLQTNGIAVILPDKRGCEKSGGEWVGASLEELATDTLSAVNFVKDQQIFEYSTIGLIGFSQGGWIAPVAATESDDISFVVSMSGSALTTDETLIYDVTYDIAPYTYTFIAKLIAPINAKNLKKKEHLSALYPFDPIPYWKDVRIPVFFAFGENDKRVPVEECIDRLRENNLNQFRVKVYPDGGHGITDSRTNRVNEEYLHDLLEFIDGATQLIKIDPES